MSETGINRNGINLVCGDTYSDISLIDEIKNKKIIFVTKNNKLKKKIKKNTRKEEIMFVSNPDILVCLLFFVS